MSVSCLISLVMIQTSACWLETLPYNEQAALHKAKTYHIKQIIYTYSMSQRQKKGGFQPSNSMEHNGTLARRNFQKVFFFSNWWLIKILTANQSPFHSMLYCDTVIQCNGWYCGVTENLHYTKWQKTLLFLNDETSTSAYCKLSTGHLYLTVSLTSKVNHNYSQHLLIFSNFNDVCFCNLGYIKR